MSTPIEGYLAWTRELLRRAIDTSLSQGSRLSTWIVVGNAAALTFTYKTMVEGSRCGLGLLQSAATCFLAGLVVSVIGAAASYVGSLRHVYTTGRLADAVGKVARYEHALREAMAEGEDPPPSGHPLVAKYNASVEAMGNVGTSRLTIACIGTAFTAVIVAAGLLAWGLSLPLQDHEALTSCRQAITN